MYTYLWFLIVLIGSIVHFPAKSTETLQWALIEEFAEIRLAVTANFALPN